MPTIRPGNSQNSDEKAVEYKNVPKFASFRPKPASLGQAQGEAVSDLSNRPRVTTSSLISGPRVDGVKNTSHRLTKDSPRKLDEKSAARNGTSQSSSAGSEQILLRDEQAPHDFMIDKVGDHDNLRFGTLHRYAASTYFRFGVGNVLGTSTAQRIDRSISNEKGVVISYSQQGALGFGDRKANLKSARTESKESRVKVQALGSQDIDHGLDFVPLRATRTQETDTSSEDTSSECDLNYEIDASSSYGQNDNHLQQRRMQLSKKIDADPSSFQAWSDFIRHHETILHRDRSHRPTNAERQSNADLRLSIYEKALQNVRDASSRENLLIGRMDVAAQLWDTAKLSIEWQSKLQQNPEYLKLWIGYLDFKQTNFESFKFEDVRNVFVTCLDLYDRHQKTAGMSNAAKLKIYLMRVHVILRITFLMMESGFVENAIATWQALVTYEFLQFSDPQRSQYKERDAHNGTAISDFEQFWDSELPRLGEDDSKEKAPKSETAVLEADQNIWESWFDSECEHGLLARRPARTMDDLAEDDPYRVVLFSDVRPFLLNAPSADGRTACLDAFLAFCQLPPCEGRDTTGMSRSWRRDGYLRKGIEEQTIAPSDKELSMGDPLPQSERTIFNMPVPDYQVSTDVLFAKSDSWFSAFETWTSQHCDEYSTIDGMWILRSLKQLVATGAGEDSLAEYVLALELRFSPETVRKSAKDLLKQRPSSLVLYNAYALIEWRLGKPNKGESTIITSINMSRTLVENKGIVLLWRTLIWELLDAGKEREALVRIMMYEDGQVQTTGNDLSENPIALLRTEKALTATRDRMISLRSHKHVVQAVDCLVVFQYLRSSSSLTAATSVFKSNLSMLSTGAVMTALTLESLHQSFARLLHYHTTHGHLVKPVEIRSLLADSITLFPQNTIFLSLYAWNEARFRIDDRVRSIIDNVVLGQGADGVRHQESVVSHLFAIHTELNRGTLLGSNASTIRSTFERAVTSKTGMHCVGLWKLYFLFELSREDIVKGKRIFWRCIKSCPWAKTLYMLAFEYLRSPGGLTNEELRSIYELMGEKELRVHVRLEATAD